MKGGSDRPLLPGDLLSRCHLRNKLVFLKDKSTMTSCKIPDSVCFCLCVSRKAAVMIQQLWRKYKQKCGNIRRGGGRDGGRPESGPVVNNRSAVGEDYAATVIQVKLNFYWEFKRNEWGQNPPTNPLLLVETPSQHICGAGDFRIFSLFILCIFLACFKVAKIKTNSCFVNISPWT